MPKRNVATNYTFEQQRQEINLIAADLWDGVLGGASTTIGDVVGWGDHGDEGYLKKDGSVATTAAFTFGNKIIGPSTFTIEPTNVNGTVVIAGNLQVDGTQTAVNSTTMDVTDLNITVAKGAANSAAADTAGITVDGANATLQYEDGSPGTWESSLGFRLDGRNASAGLKLNLAGSADYLIRESTTDDIVQFGGTGAANFFTHNLSSGNFGIAEANPSYKLDVNGTLRVTGNSTFGANGSITSAANFTLNGNALTVTGTATAVGEFKGATIPTIQVTQTTDNTDLQLRANATGGLVRTAGAFPLIFGTFQEERLRIHESNAFVTVNHGNAETNSALILSKADAGYAKLEFDVGTSQKAYVELDASENLIHYGAAGVSQKFYAGGSSRLTITDGGDVKIGLDSVTTRTDSAHFGFNITGKSGTTGAGSIFFNDSADNCDANIAADDGVLMITADYSDNTAGSAIKFRVDGSSEKMSINSDGQINLGTNGVNQAQFCQAGNNHYIVGQAADNVAALEVYSQHGSSYNKISFGVYDNRTGSKSASFLIRGDGQVEDSKGPLRSVPATEPGNANYTLVASDAGKYVDSQGTGREITVPSGTFSQGDVVTILRATSGDVTIKQGSGLTMYHSADGANTTTGDRTLSQRGMVTMIFVSANYCYISGTGLS